MQEVRTRKLSISMFHRLLQLLMHLFTTEPSESGGAEVGQVARALSYTLAQLLSS